MRDPGWAKQNVKASIDFLAQTLADKKKIDSQGQVASARSWLRIITCAIQSRRNETLLGMASPRVFRRSAAGSAVGGAVIENDECSVELVSENARNEIKDTLLLRQSVKFVSLISKSSKKDTLLHRLTDKLCP